METRKLYDELGKGYRNHRIPDPWIEEAIWNALGWSKSVVNVGAGTGSYEPIDRYVVAVEPSSVVQAYLPEIVNIDRNIFPTIQNIEYILGAVKVFPLPIPGDCTDGFLGAYWRRPEAYLNTDVRNGMSSFSRLSSIDKGLNRLRQDLGTGNWEERYGYLLKQEELDVGYRILVAGCNINDSNVRISV